MSEQTNVADYIVRRLAGEGITDCFGVAGDFAFKLNDAVARSERIRWIGCSNELEAAYAADGYARMRGCSMLMTTYAVGELSGESGLGLQRPGPLELSRSARRLGLPGLVHGQGHNARSARCRTGQGFQGRIGVLHRGRRRQDGLSGGPRRGPSASRCLVRK